MNLAKFGTLNRASYMAYSVKEGKCPMLFLHGEKWQRKSLSQFLFDKTNHAKRSVIVFMA